MSKFRECTIFRKDHNEHWRVLSIDTKLLPYINGHIDMVEITALEQSEAKNKELETKLTNYMLGFATQTERCELLEAKLSIAVEALEIYENLDNYERHGLVNNDQDFYAKKALEKLRGENE